jgi:hypothetical protein
MSQAAAADNKKVSVEKVVKDMNHDDDNDDDYFADVGFMFESQQPVRLEKFRWDIPTRHSYVNDNDNTYNHSDGIIQNAVPQPTTVQIALHVADDHPGAVQSGHYLWPAATMLSEYLINQYHYSSTSNDDQTTNDHRCPRPINTVIELGAGCAMVSFVALQLWKETLQCICITDHDPSTLVRARDNYETTIQLLFNNETCLGNDLKAGYSGDYLDANDDDDDDDNCDEQLNTIINTITNIPVLFESLEWGDGDAVEKLLYQTLPEHLPLDVLLPFSSKQHRSTDNNNNNNHEIFTTRQNHHFDIVLGSDLIYCKEVVRPLFTTAVQLMHSSDNVNSSTGSCFILAQSFVYDTSTENEIDEMCMELQLHRTIVIDFDSERTTGSDKKTASKGRIQEFLFQT